MAADVAAACSYARQRLAEELPRNLTYHTLAHTEEVVVPAASVMAVASGVDGWPLELLEVAAWFHDLGYIGRYERNEPIAVEIAWEVLPDLGFPREDVLTIERMIWATQLPQKPKTLLEEVLVDADLDALGHADFWVIQDLLRQEFASNRGAVDDRTWIEDQIAFIDSHRYFTQAARDRNDAAKAQHVAELRARLTTRDRTR